MLLVCFDFFMMILIHTTNTTDGSIDIKINDDKQWIKLCKDKTIGIDYNTLNKIYLEIENICS